MANPHDVDILIIGAGISGINSAYRVQERAPAGTTYAILERRDSLGGTWDFFKYPGIRSDSDITTFGFDWAPWDKHESLAPGRDIKSYIAASAAKFGIDKHIQYNHKVLSAAWSSQQRKWTVTVEHGGKEETYTSRFILLSTGYYDYDQPLQTTIPGIDNFKGKVIHPQFWPTDYDYSNKSIVIIGSGATAVTLLPSVLDKAKSATMLQRSPSYIFALPLQDHIGDALSSLFPAVLAGRLNRAAWLLKSFISNWFCKTYPETAKRAIRLITKSQLPPDVHWDPHFKPAYNPWEQRFCACQDGDFFAALRSGRGKVVTDRIKQVTESEIVLESGAEPLRPDVIVTATGLKLKFAGGVKFTVDGETIEPSSKRMWKNCMISDVPNLVMMIGYQDASWTLGVDVVILTFLRVLQGMQKKGASVVVPRVGDEKMEQASLMSLSSTYLKNMNDVFPRGGPGQWAPRTHYFADLKEAKFGDVVTGLEIS